MSTQTITAIAQAELQREEEEQQKKEQQRQQQAQRAAAAAFHRFKEEYAELHAALLISGIAVRAADHERVQLLYKGRLLTLRYWQKDSVGNGGTLRLDATEGGELLLGLKSQALAVYKHLVLPGDREPGTLTDWASVDESELPF